MNRKNSKKSTPKKTSASKRSTTRKKTSNSTPNKSTPMKTRSARTLPKSPISESMKQSKINDFFKPLLSQSIESIKTESSSQPSEPEVIEVMVKKTVERKTRKGPKVLEPIFGQKRHSLRKSDETNSAKKLRLEASEQQNQSSNQHKNSAKQLFSEALEVPDNNNSHNSLTEDVPKVSKKAKKSTKRGKTVCDQNLNEMMTELKIIEIQKTATNATNILKSTVNNDSLEDKQNSEMIDTNANHLCGGITNNLDEDIDLMPVFKVPEVPKPKKISKENNKYVDKEKEKRMSYFLKNLRRIKKDKEMLIIESIEDMQMMSEMEDKSEDTEHKTEFRIKPFEGIDIFSDYIPKTIEKYLTQVNEISLEGSLFSELPLSSLCRCLPIIGRRVKETERQQIISQIIHLVSTEESLIICAKLEFVLIEMLSQTDWEIYLSLILKDFYQILSTICVNMKKQTDSELNECLIKKELKLLSNVIRVMSHILTKCSLKFEAMDSVEEFIKLLTISFALGLDYRVIKSDEQIIDLKNFIAVILNHIFVDEIKAIPITENLISFCTSDEKIDVNISLQIVSLFPLNIDFELKRMFCISIIQLFAPKNYNQFEKNLSEIQNILEEIIWKSLTPEDIYVIIQMIGLSLDLPKDLIEHKETIASILGILCNKINTSVPKESDFELNEIHKLVMILRTKVNVSTKRF